mmetsp:Transcript_100067/g.288951  ORF Transcript_100067/g.288951 Transcript_100067/m.288951 type:complete len:192 (+) Transcript_100067:1089-1664(+)
MSVTTSLRNARSCDTTRTVCGYVCKWFSNQSTASKSKWFVGSSNMRISGRMNKAAAIAARTRQPPDIEESGAFCISSVNCNPARRVRARESAVFASISSKRSCTSASRVESSAFSLSAFASTCSCNSFSVARSVCNSTSASMTASITRISELPHSWLTWRQRKCFGNPSISWAAIAFNKVVFPIPFFPMSP